LSNTPIAVKEPIVVVSTTSSFNPTVIIMIISFVFFSCFYLVAVFLFGVTFAYTFTTSTSITTFAASRTAATYDICDRFRARWRPPKPAPIASEALNKTLHGVDVSATTVWRVLFQFISLLT